MEADPRRAQHPIGLAETHGNGHVVSDTLLEREFNTAIVNVVLAHSRNEHHERADLRARAFTVFTDPHFFHLPLFLSLPLLPSPSLLSLFTSPLEVVSSLKYS